MKLGFTLLPLLLHFPVFAQTAARSIVETVAADAAFSSAAIGVYAAKADGKTIVDYYGEKALLPASNMKLISTGLAINELGPGFQIETKIAYSGHISGGILHGDVYVIGGGDPTIASKDSIAITAETLFAKWMGYLKTAGIKSVEGRIIGDGRYFDGETEEQSWLYEDVGNYYGTGCNGLCFYRNALDFSVAAGGSTGSELTIKKGYPQTDWLSLGYRCSTGAAETGDQLYLFCNDLVPVAELRGTFGLDCKPKTIKGANKFGAYTCAWYFCEYLKAKGVSVSGSCADIDREGRIREDLWKKGGEKAASQDSLTVIGSTFSPSIKRIAYITNHRSDNFYAEALFRIVGKENVGSAAYPSCREAAMDALARLRMGKPNGIQIIDGSGLSRKNLVSPAFFCLFLKAMTGTRFFPDYLYTLTQREKTGANGEKIYWKSGSMGGVRCYSGYIIPPDGNVNNSITFSVMINNCPAPSWKITQAIDRIVDAIAAEL